MHSITANSASMQKKEEFLKKWIEGLQICCSTNLDTNKQMNVMERKKKIKLSADIAMISCKKTATCWSNALINSYAKQNQQDSILVNKLLSGPESSDQLRLQKTTTSSCRKRIILMKKRMKMIKKKKKKMMMRRRTNYSGWKCSSSSASVIAKRLVRKRTEVLKRIVPGGESMDEFSLLIKEALDYILSLKLQVDVMRSVVAATDQV